MEAPPEPLVVTTRSRRGDQLLVLLAAMPNPAAHVAGTILGFLVAGVVLTLARGRPEELVRPQVVLVLALAALTVAVIEWRHRRAGAGQRLRLDEAGLTVDERGRSMTIPWARLAVRETEAAFILYPSRAAGFVLHRADLDAAGVARVRAWAGQARSFRAGEPARPVTMLATGTAILAFVIVYNLLR